MIDLSADMGEGAPDEPAIWPLIDAASIACGGHTGDRHTVRQAIGQCARYDVIVGAHPSYPDREGFGRRSISIDRETLHRTLVDQLATVRELAAEAMLPLRRVKPHGALYNDAHQDRDLAAIIVAAIRQLDPEIALVCSTTSAMALAARGAGSPVVREAFADRRYEQDGSLVARGVPGALLDVDEASDQAHRLVTRGTVLARDGSEIPLPFDTICIHADMERAAARLTAIRKRIAG